MFVWFGSCVLHPRIFLYFWYTDWPYDHLIQSKIPLSSNEENTHSSKTKCKSPASECHLLEVKYLYPNRLYNCYTVLYIRHPYIRRPEYEIPLRGMNLSKDVVVALLCNLLSTYQIVLNIKQGIICWINLCKKTESVIMFLGLFLFSYDVFYKLIYIKILLIYKSLPVEILSVTVTL